MIPGSWDDVASRRLKGLQLCYGSMSVQPELIDVMIGALIELMHRRGCPHKFYQLASELDPDGIWGGKSEAAYKCLAEVIPKEEDKTEVR